MSKLEELIVELCPSGVKLVALGDVLKNNNASNSISKKEYKDKGIIPIIDQSQSYIAGYTDDASAIPPVLPCIIFGDHTRVVKYADHDFAQGDSGTKVFIPVKETLDTKYIYYAFCNLEIPSRGYNRHWSIVKDMKIPIPPLPVQSEIVRILDNFTELKAELKAELTMELTARKTQYEYYKNILFSFSSNVEWTKLSDVCEIYDSLHQTPKYSNTGFPMVRVVDVKGDVINRDTCLKVDEQVYKQFIKKYKPKVNDIVISRVGSYGNVGLVINDDVCLGQNVALISAKHCSCNFLFYYLQSNLVRVFIESNVNGASQKTLSLAKIKDIPFPKLTEEEQNRISVLMGNFHKICNDITTGLPAEIEARKKQYEYYRDKLLTFKELS